MLGNFDLVGCNAVVYFFSGQRHYFENSSLKKGKNGREENARKENEYLILRRSVLNIRKKVLATPSKTSAGYSQERA